MSFRYISSTHTATAIQAPTCITCHTVKAVPLLPLHFLYQVPSAVENSLIQTRTILVNFDASSSRLL
ncbi:hypothetical protein M422DRAFT_34408 [Sphaerobolus stellatus SS14]|uniref:Uncharacterized protein n=1 Tax=Sphaerobolus stellatus (strain SS14) TaxID=990650 RepID=A0A0C9U092_SPHS4|nr:hypothetical protein M422DRAFT_34408 [Sphaerobolus stellatus SS14]